MNSRPDSVQDLHVASPVGQGLSAVMDDSSLGLAHLSV